MALRNLFFLEKVMMGIKSGVFVNRFQNCKLFSYKLLVGKVSEIIDEEDTFETRVMKRNGIFGVTIQGEFIFHYLISNRLNSEKNLKILKLIITYFMKNKFTSYYAFINISRPPLRRGFLLKVFFIKIYLAILGTLLDNQKV
jgi:hypothetical protein